MTVLVAGGAGYIGSHTVVELLNEGYDVVVVDNFSNSSPVVLERLKTITGKTVRYYSIDIVDKEALRDVFKKESIQSVIHFAGYKAVGESVEKPVDYYKNNLLSTLTLIEVMKENNVKNIVFSSSATVYGANNVSPLVETMPVGMPESPYGYTKVVCEQILRDVAQANSDWAIALLRYFNPIGAHSSGLIGENPIGIPNNLMPFVSQVAVGKREHLNIFGNDYDTPDGTCIRDYIHVVDLAKGHVKALNKLKQTAGVVTYNLGSGSGTSVLELVNTFMNVTGVSVPYKIVNRRPGDIAVCYSDATLALTELGWKTEKTIADMCFDTWRWQSQNPKGYE